MSTSHQSPIFCDNCSLLALAVLDGAPLCIRCLQSELALSEDPNHVNKISPLEFELLRLNGAMDEPPLPSEFS